MGRKTESPASTLYLDPSPVQESTVAPHCPLITEVEQEGLSPCDSAPASSILSLSHPTTALHLGLRVPVPSMMVRKGLFFTLCSPCLLIV